MMLISLQHITLWVIILACYCCCCYSESSAVRVDDTDVTIPALLWQIALPESGSNHAKRGLRSGNGIVLARDGVQLWIVADDGHLFVLDSRTGDVIRHVSPSEVRSADEDESSILRTESRSSVSIHYNANNSNTISFVVYVITEIMSAPVQEKTRIVALYGDGSLWRTQLEDGVAEGTTIISNDGSKIILNLNTIESDNVRNPSRKGHSLVLNLIDWSRDIVDSFEHYPYGEAAYDDKNGMIYWADPWRFGYGDRGVLYSRSNYANATQLHQLDFSSITAPIVSENSDKIWLGGSRAELRSWKVDVSSNDELIPLWNRSVQLDKRNRTSRKYTFYLKCIFISN